MKLVYSVITFLLLNFTWPTVSLKIYTETTWHKSIPVGEYKSYSSVNLAKYTIPYNTIKSTWLFRAERYPKECESRTVHVYLQHGSFPLINPLNETYPDDFYVERTDLQLIELHATNNTRIMGLDMPLPGHWFTASIMGNYEDIDDSVKQKGIGMDCRYAVSVTHIVEAYDNVDTLITGVPYELSAHDGTHNLFKFHTSKSTWSYIIKISGCIYTMTASNFTSNSTTKSTTSSTATPINATCPLFLSTRDQALPSLEDEEMYWKNCSDAAASSSCTLKVPSPPTNDWSYIRFRSAHPQSNNGSVSFTLMVELKECVLSPLDEKAEVDEQIYEVSSNGTQTNASLPTPPWAFADELIGDSEYGKLLREYLLNVTDMALHKTPGIAISTEEKQFLAEQRAREQPATVAPMSFAASTDDEATEQNITSCMKMEELGRFEQPHWAFQVAFSARIGIMFVPNRVIVSDEEVLVMTFSTQTIVDTGGTLYYRVQLDEGYLNDSSQVVTVESCIQRLGIPMTLTGVQCDHQLFKVLNNSGSNSSELFFPYPEAGAWFITLLAKCYSNDSLLEREPCRQELLVVAFELRLGACIQGCGEYGSCREYFSGVMHFASCRCQAKYRGIACNDATVAYSDSQQLIAALLLTLSNLAFLPAIIVAAYRRFYIESLIYAYTMFFSTFYHACDGDRKYVYCLMPFNVLSHCDFFGAILSVWVTLITMARLAESRRTFLFMVGALGLAIGVTWDKHSLGVFLVPSAVALAIMFASWGFQCHRRHQCYPPMKRWLFYLIPGVLIALLGLIIFAFLETETNYRYTHSSWHCCMAFCIVLLIPPRSKHSHYMEGGFGEEEEAVTATGGSIGGGEVATTSTALQQCASGNIWGIVGTIVGESPSLPPQPSSVGLPTGRESVTCTCQKQQEDVVTHLYTACRKALGKVKLRICPHDGDDGGAEKKEEDRGNREGGEGGSRANEEEVEGRLLEAGKDACPV